MTGIDQIETILRQFVTVGSGEGRESSGLYPLQLSGNLVLEGVGVEPARSSNGAFQIHQLCLPGLDDAALVYSSVRLLPTLGN